jgi:hypothetical protein
MQQHCEGVGGVPINISDASGFCEREGREGRERGRAKARKWKGERAIFKRGVRVCCENRSG